MQCVVYQCVFLNLIIVHTKTTLSILYHAICTYCSCKSYITTHHQHFPYDAWWNDSPCRRRGMFWYIWKWNTMFPLMYERILSHLVSYQIWSSPVPYLFFIFDPTLWTVKTRERSTFPVSANLSFFQSCTWNWILKLTLFVYFVFPDLVKDSDRTL